MKCVLTWKILMEIKGNFCDFTCVCRMEMTNVVHIFSTQLIFTILHRYAQYSEFKLGSEKEKYRLEIGGYEGNAGDSLNDPWYGSNLRPFSTFDK